MILPWVLGLCVGPSKIKLKTALPNFILDHPAVKELEAVLRDDKIVIRQKETAAEPTNTTEIQKKNKNRRINGLDHL